MNLFKMIEDVENRLLSISNIEVNEKIGSAKIATNELKEVERNIEIEFPRALSELYLNFTSEISFLWSAEESAFGKKCKNGRLNILSPRKIERIYSDMKLVVDEANKSGDELEENEGLQALVNDWMNWVPIIGFPNGDAFCIEKRSSGKQIVFLEHDVMDGGPNLHGLKIASNFDVLMENWAKVNFVDIFDWTLGVNEDGIDTTKAIFDKMLGRS